MDRPNWVRWMARVLAVALLAVLTLAGRTPEALAVPVEAPGLSSSVSISHAPYGGLYGFDCTGSAAMIAAYPDATFEDPTYRVDGTLSCRTKRIQGDLKVSGIELRTSNGDCRWYGGWGAPEIRDLDDESERDFSFTASPDSSGECLEPSGYPSVVTEVCLIGDDGSYCGSTYLVPPVNPEPGSAAPPEGAQACPRGSPLVPWVTEIHAEEVAGGWAWVSDAVVRVTDQDTVSLSSTSPSLIGTYKMYLHGYIQTTGAPAQLEVVAPSNAGKGTTTGTTTKSLSAAMDFTLGPGSTFVFGPTELHFRVRGATKTGTPGSGVPDWAYSRVGVYVATSPQAYFGSGFSDPTPTEAEYGATPTGGVTMAGNNKPEWCFMNWGAQFGASVAGPIDYQAPTETTPPDPLVPVPVVEIDPGGGCSPAATVCVVPPDPDDPDENPSVPDPDSEGCDFSITDPASWGGQLICALTKLVGMMLDAIGSLVGAITGLVAALLEGLLDLLVSLFVPDELPDFSGFEVALPDGWIGAFPSLGDPGCGTISMPSLRLPLVGETGASQLVDTCDEPWPLVRSMTYYGVLAYALISLANRAFRMVLDAVGMGIDAAGDALPSPGRADK